MHGAVCTARSTATVFAVFTCVIAAMRATCPSTRGCHDDSHRKLLARRLLGNRCLSIDVERRVLAALGSARLPGFNAWCVVLLVRSADVSPRLC